MTSTMTMVMVMVTMLVRWVAKMSYDHGEDEEGDDDNYKDEDDT